MRSKAESGVSRMVKPLARPALLIRIVGEPWLVRISWVAEAMEGEEVRSQW